MLPSEIHVATETILREKFGNGLLIKSFSSSSGGCINLGGRLLTSHGSFFIKWNDAVRFPNMFDGEASGLKLLKDAMAIRIPDVIDVGEADSFQFIILEYIETQRPSRAFWQALAEQLSTLHKTTADYFGLDHNNYMGSLPQLNNPSSSWVDFFIENRLNVQLKLAIDAGKMNVEYIERFNKLYTILPSLLIEEPPTLVHGDLWNGNLLCDDKGQPCLIDPAVYFGNREVDLAMTKLFGGFDPEFYEAYQAAFPTASGQEKRLDIYNLYPLLVHVKLFGGGYVHQVNSILKRYAKD